MGFFLTGIIAPALHYFLPQKYETDLPGQDLREFLFFICGWGISFFLIFSGIRILLETARIMICLSSVSFLVLLYCILLHCVSALRHIRCGLRSAVQGAVFAAFMQICLFGTLHILLLPFEELLQ